MFDKQSKKLAIIRRKQLEQRMGIGRSTIYLRINQSLITSPVSLGANSVGWPEHEIDAILALFPLRVGEYFNSTR